MTAVIQKMEQLNRKIKTGHVFLMPVKMVSVTFDDATPTQFVNIKHITGNLEVVQELIDHGFDVNLKDKLLRTSLHYAADKGLRIELSVKSN